MKKKKIEKFLNQFNMEIVFHQDLDYEDRNAQAIYSWLLERDYPYAKYNEDIDLHFNHNVSNLKYYDKDVLVSKKNEFYCSKLWFLIAKGIHMKEKNFQQFIKLVNYFSSQNLITYDIYNRNILYQFQETFGKVLIDRRLISSKIIRSVFVHLKGRDTAISQEIASDVFKLVNNLRELEYKGSNIKQLRTEIENILEPTFIESYFDESEFFFNFINLIRKDFSIRKKEFISEDEKQSFWSKKERFLEASQ